MIRSVAVSVLLLATLAMAGSAAAASVREVTVEGSQFRVVLTDGSVLPQENLPGVVLAIGDGSGQQRRIRIDSVTPDPLDPAAEVMLYTLAEQAPDGAWHNLCQPGPDGRRAGFPIPGVFAQDMRHVAAPGRLSITCTGGAEAKCIRFGYKPWRHAPDGSSLVVYYQTCLRLVRADYCGDGVGHTRNGMLIDLFDRIGIQQDEIGPGMTLEAAWGPDGAVCVAHTRLPEQIGLDAVCPRLAGRIGASCTEVAPALLFNRSVPP